MLSKGPSIAGKARNDAGEFYPYLPAFHKARIGL